MKKILSLAVLTAVVFATVIFTPGQFLSVNRLFAADDNGAAEPKAGERKVVTIKGVDFAFRYCPAGTFTMGSPKNEQNRRANEPQHEVQITKGFWLGETEVTQEQWGEITKDNPSAFKGRKLPVERVSWNDCRKYIEQLNDNAPAGFKFAFPTEAQWEYACRAGSKTAYCFGDDAEQLGDYAWYYGNNYGNTTPTPTHDVATKKANAWGLYDMHGNVWEWCSDWYDTYYGNKQLEKNYTPAGKNMYGEDLPQEELVVVKTEELVVVKTMVDPTGASSGDDRVRRGGGWGDRARNCRSALRFISTPENRNNGIGLRLALVSVK